MSYELLGTNQPDADEAAAIGAALVVVFSETPNQPSPALQRSQWEDSGKLSQQGLRPARTGVRPQWNTIERLRQRAAGGFYGIPGM